MPSYLIPTLLLQIFIVGYTPGPANIFALSTAIRFGRRSALIAWLGLLTGFCTAALVTSTLTHYIGLMLGDYIIWLKYIGGGYIMYLAYKALKMRVRTSDNTQSTFWSGYIVQLTNAKTIMFELSVYSSFVLPYSSNLADLYIVAAWLLIAGPMGNLMWIAIGTTLKRFFEKNTRVIDIATAIALAGCSLFIIFS